MRDRILKHSIPEPNTGCWLWTGAISVRPDRAIAGGKIARDGKWLRASRVAYAAFVGPIPPGMYVCHHCDTPACVNPDHLFLGTQFDNMRDMARKGRQNFQRRPHEKPRGESNGLAKLNAGQVVAIRALGELKTQREIADLFGIAQGHVHRILSRKRWAHV